MESDMKQSNSSGPSAEAYKHLQVEYIKNKQ